MEEIRNVFEFSIKEQEKADEWQRKNEISERFNELEQCNHEDLKHKIKELDYEIPYRTRFFKMQQEKMFREHQLSIDRLYQIKCRAEYLLEMKELKKIKDN